MQELYTGQADHLLFAGGKAVGVIEAKPEGTTLGGVAEQSGKYLAGLPERIPHVELPLPFAYESTGTESYFRDERDPHARSRRVFAFHRPETLQAWAEEEFQQYVTPDDGRKFTELYNVQRLTSPTIDPVSRICIATIQRIYSFGVGFAGLLSRMVRIVDFHMRQTSTLGLMRLTLLAFLLVFLSGPTPSRVPDDRVTENLRAFARLYGYVRWFHPSDQAASIDWERFAVYGVQQVQDAATPQELRAALETLFLPLAPTLRIYAEGGTPVHSSLVPQDTTGLKLVAWQHRGVGLSTGTPYRSVRLNRPAPFRESQGLVLQQQKAQALRGRTVRLSASTRLITDGQRGRLHLFLQVKGGNETTFFDDMKDRPITSESWTRHEIVGPVAENATTITFGAALVGTGEGRLNDLRLEVQENGEWQEIQVANPGFETVDADGTPSGWTIQRSERAKHQIALKDDNAKRVLTITLDREPVAEPLFPEAPAVGEAVDKPLGRGLRAWVPLALYSNDQGTLGGGSADALSQLTATLEALDLPGLGAEVAAVRMADVIIAWNVFQHFYPYFDVVNVDWNNVLTETLVLARQDADAPSFLHTLNHMLAYLDDGHAEAFHPFLREQRALPIRVDWIEGQVVVVASNDPETARIGDVVLSLDGVPVQEWLEQAMGTFSGSVRWKRHRALTHPLRGFGRGEAGSEARLELLREGQIIEVRRIRDVPETPKERRPEDFQEVADSILYVHLDRVSMTDLEARIHELATARGVVFDVRGYPKGNHQILAHLTDGVLRSGYFNTPRFIYPDRERIVGWDTGGRWTLEPRRPQFKGQAVFLTDERAISYAEGFIEIVKAYGLGEIVGQTTAGANGNSNPFNLPGGYALGWTGMTYLKHDSTQHHVVGISPTVPVDRRLEAVRAGRDDYLEAALELILAEQRR